MEYKIPIGKSIESIIDIFIDHFAEQTQAFSYIIKTTITVLSDFYQIIPPLAIITILPLMLLIYKHKSEAAITFVGLLFIFNMGYWPEMIETIILIKFSLLFSLGVGIPIGLVCGIYPKTYFLIGPILNLLQTLPAFVFLIPTLAFFGLGSVSAIFATFLFSVPAIIRPTYLGIRQIPREINEAADSFGASKTQKLLLVTIPMAMPNILQGITQTIMLSLSMVVIASMIGAEGLGGVVWKAIQRLDLAAGIEAGLCIVFLATMFDSILRIAKTQQLNPRPH